MRITRLILFSVMIISASLQAQWALVSNNLTSATVSGAMKLEYIDGVFYLCSLQHGLFTSTDGVNWKSDSNGLPKMTAAGFTIYGAVRGIAKMDGKLYVAAMGSGSAIGGVFFRALTDTVWQKTTAGLSGLYTAPTGIILADNRLIFTSGAGVFLLNQGDTTWVRSNTGLPAVAPVPAHPTFSGGNIYTYLGGLAGTAGVYTSTNNGTSWSRETGFWDQNNGAFYILQHEGKLYATTSNGVFTKTIGDTGWVQNLNGFSDMGKSSNHIVAAGSKVYVGTTEGPYYSSDGGATWTADHQGLPTPVFAAQGLAAASDELYVYMTTLGVYKKTVTTDIAGTELTPGGFSLEQNYPNPFNPTTTISFTVPRAAQVTIGIYNIAGQLIATLTEREFQAGTYSVTWNGTDNLGQKVTSGMYFCRMESGDFTAVRKLVLLK